MADCGVQHAGGRRPNMDKESDHQGPESSDDRSAAPHEENPEYPLEKKQVPKRNLFTAAQLNTLEALFKDKVYLSTPEVEQLATHLSVPQRKIQRWFEYRRAKVKHLALNPKKTPVQDQKKLDQRGPESSDDRSAADTECLLNKIQLHKKTVFPEEQQMILEAFFKKKPYLGSTERQQLANKLSVSRRKIQKWFQYQRAKMRRDALNPKKTPVQDQAGNSKTPTQAQQDLRHKQKMEATIKCVQAQKWSYLVSFPPLWPMDSYVLPQGPHSSNMVYCQNVGGPPDSRCGTEVYQMPPESGHNPPNAFHFNLCLPNKINKPGTSIWTRVPPVTIDLMSDDGPSTSSAPSTSQMPIAPDNADEGSSTDTASPLIDVEATDSD